MTSSTFSQLNARALSVANSAIGPITKVRRASVKAGQVLDFAPDGVGSLAGGLLLTQICLSNLAEVAFVPGGADLSLNRVQVVTDFPLEACIASQYAGWPFSHNKYFAMCSGPARIARGQEEILTSYQLTADQHQVVGVLETRQLPSDAEMEEFAKQCDVSPENVTLCVAPTASIPAAVQIVGRSVETTLHKLHELGFDLTQIKSACGVAPIPPIANDDLVALGWTNDSILYGADVQLWVKCEDRWLEAWGEKIPSESSSDFGRPFQEIFEKYQRDFYQIDKHLFSPARVTINNLNSGRTYVFGRIHTDILKQSFGMT